MFDLTQMANCYQDFYTGKPHRSVMLFGQKAIYIATRTPSLSLVWSSQWADITHVSASQPQIQNLNLIRIKWNNMIDQMQVKWNYSTLTLSSGVGTFGLDFGDPHVLRMCASLLDIGFRRIGKDNCIVAVETPFECRSFWHPWMQQHTTDIVSDSHSKNL